VKSLVCHIQRPNIRYCTH